MKLTRSTIGKVILKTGLITAVVIAGLACFAYNVSFNPDFSALDFITSASPKKKAKNRKPVQETVYGIQDFVLNEPLDSFDEIPVESGILLRRKTPLYTPMLFPVDADSPVYLKKCTRQADSLREQGYEIQMRPCHPFEFTALIHAGKFDLLLLTETEEDDADVEDNYVVDIGLRHHLLGGQRQDVGHILENVVYLELLRRGGKVYVGKVGGLEVDFMVETSDGTEYYQVAASVRDPSTLERELAPFYKIRDNHPKFLLTLDEDPNDNIDGTRKLNVLDWLLQ